MGKKKNPAFNAALRRNVVPLQKQGFKPGVANFSRVNMAPSQQMGMTSLQYYPLQVPPVSIYEFIQQLPVQPQYTVTPKKKKKKKKKKVQPPAMNNQRPGTNISINQLPAQSKSSVTAKKKNEPTGGNIQSPGTNINMKQLPPQSKNTAPPKKKMQQSGMNTQQLASKSANTPGLQSSLPSKDSSATATSTSGGTGKTTQPNNTVAVGQNIQHTKPQYVQKPGTNIYVLQQPVQPQCKETQNTQMQPAGMSKQRPGTNINKNHLPAQPVSKVTGKKKKKALGGNIQSPGTNINKNQLPAQPESNVTGKKKKKALGGNIQSPGTNINKNQIQAQPKSKVTAKKKKKATGGNIQSPGTNVNMKQLPSQSKNKVTPMKKMQPSGMNIQQPALKSANAPGLKSSLPSQDSSTTVTSTSGGTESAAASKQVIEEVDLTDEVIVLGECKRGAKEVIEVDLTQEDTEENATEKDTEVNSTKEVMEVENAKEVIKVENEVIEVDSTNAARLLAAQPDILSDTNPDLWHKVTVNPAVVDRIAVLNAINRRIAPLKLVPYFFSREDGHITFLVNNCSAPLAALFKRNLKVPFFSIEIELKVQLRAKKLNLSAILQRIINKRLSTEKTFLDLSKLNSIPEVQEVVYNPSDTSDLQQQLLKTAQILVPNLASLSLARNELSTLKHLKSVFTDRTKWTSVKVLDVSDNKITTASELAVFSFLQITELYLHRNPVCGKYKEDHTYISVVRVIFPRLIKLDGTYLQRMPGIPRWRPNYIFCSTHGDSAELADQFVEHFFTLYDSEDRTWLWDLYHDDAYFSISSLYLPGQSTSHNARLSSYVAECRNLLHPSNKLRSKDTLCRGAEKILAKLDRLPRTQHDPHSFTVDLLHHSDKCAILTVTGVFREQNLKQNISPRHFMRTFVLVKLVNDEYQIANDILYVTNATTEEAEAAFRHTQPIPKKTKPQRQVTDSDKNSMIGRFSQLTGMTIEWSRKSLVCAGWNLRRALEKFISLYQAGKIPAFKFIKNQKK